MTQWYQSIDEAREARRSSATWQRSVVTLGNFDGVHLGHQALLDQTASLARARDALAVALTFDPHPARLFRPELPPFELTSMARRVALLQQHGADVVLTLPFDRELAAQRPEAFVEQMLVEALGACGVIVGEDFRFGHKRAGDTQTLRDMGASHGFDLILPQVVCLEDEVVSSTRIREALRQAQVELAARLLGRPHQLEGRIVHGDARGRTLGYPTANLDPEQAVLMPDGIYTTTLHSARYGATRAVSYIGSRPTFAEAQGRNVETFVLDPPQGEEGFDLYDAPVQLAFHHYQRGDVAYTSDAALIAQMDEDVRQARAWHAGHTA